MTLAIALEPTPIETDIHGVVRVAKTRITLDTVVTAFLEGCAPEEIGEQCFIQLASAIAFLLEKISTGKI